MKIDGLPTIRPRCPQCDKLLGPLVEDKTERRPIGNDGGFTYVKVARKFVRWNSYGAFCTLRCCEQFANSAFLAGYRAKR